MKKAIALVLICLTLFTVGICYGKIKTDTQPDTTEEDSVLLSSNEAAYIYNKAYSLAATWFNTYNEYWNQEDFFIDAENNQCFSIKHETINSVEKLKSYLCVCFSRTLVDSVIDATYFDKDGKLYQRALAAGDRMPTYYLNLTKATLTSESEEKVSYNITLTKQFENVILGNGKLEDTETVNIEYVKENGNWVIDNFFKQTLYAPYEWDGESVGVNEDENKEDKFNNSTGKIVTEASDNIMMSFYNEETEEFSDKLFSNWASDATVVEFEKDYSKELSLTDDTSLVKLDSPYALDISEAGDGSVVAYLTTDGTDIVLHIAGDDGVVMANENSQGVFWYYWTETSEYAESVIREIHFNNCFNTSRATTMSMMFSGCKKLTTLDLTGFDTSNVTDMSEMFYSCKSLISVDVSNFDTSNVESMSQMFDDCKKLSDLYLSNFNTSKVTDMNYMFSTCETLTALDLSNFNTVNVKSMDALFSTCKSLVYLNISNFDTSNVTSMRYMFGECEAITSLDVSSFNTSNVTIMDSMFKNCFSLVSVDVSGFDTSNVTNFAGMFGGCASLETLDVSNFDTSSSNNNGGLSYRRSVFEGCYNTEIKYNGQIYKYGRSPNLYALEDDFFGVVE